MLPLARVCHWHSKTPHHPPNVTRISEPHTSLLWLRRWNEASSCSQLPASLLFRRSCGEKMVVPRYKGKISAASRRGEFQAVTRRGGPTLQALEVHGSLKGQNIHGNSSRCPHPSLCPNLQFFQPGPRSHNRSATDEHLNLSRALWLSSPESTFQPCPRSYFR